MKRIAVLLVVLLTSCFREKEITIEFPYEPKPIFYGFLGNSNGSSVSAFESLPLTAKEPSYPLFNGQAYLLENGWLVDTFTVDPEGIFRSSFRISKSSDYRVHFTDGVNSYESDEVLLPEGNRIMSSNIYRTDDSDNAFLELDFEQPLSTGDEILLFSSPTMATPIEDSYRISEDRKKATVRFDYIYPIYGPSKFLIGYDTIDVVKVEVNYFSYEKSRFSESRNGSGEVISAGSNFHNPTWTNIENAYGYVTSYISDSLFIEL